MLTRTASALLGILAAVPALGGTISGDPNDIYALDDAWSNVYQYDRTSLSYVPGSYSPSGLSSPYDYVFSNNSQLQTNAPFLGAVAGPNQNFFIGGLVNGLVEIDSATGAYVQTIAPGQRAGPAKAPNGNIVVGGPTGVEEYNSATGAFVRTVTAYGSGVNIHTFKGNEMFVGQWTYSPGLPIKRYNFITGLPSGADIIAPFGMQEIGIGPDGNLYGSALLNGEEGLWKYDFGTSLWSHYIDTTPEAGGGPHGFTFDPTNYDIYFAFYTGEIHRYSFGGSYLGLVDALPTKLTDILFKQVVPEPGTIGLLAMGGLALVRRRRARA
ncbi:MAG: PEP-CTERM sorting domain-containing protein [Phycisphaerae bacterium]|nr:PEP-CTERM sorting domain-containing protein [Phycisphaerae bacterium]